MSEELDPIELLAEQLVRAPGFQALSIFCFFCGKEVGPAESRDKLAEMCANRNFKRFKPDPAYPKPFYDGERWVCADCRGAVRRDVARVKKK